MRQNRTMHATESVRAEKSDRVKNLCLASFFAALITLMTIVFRLPIGVNGGYIHMGDAFVYLAASLLPLPYGLLAAGVGGCLADTLSGAVLWAPATLIIKILVALPFTFGKNKILCKRNIAAMCLAFPVTGLGYFLAESLIYDVRVAFISSVGSNFFQSLGSAGLYILFALALDRMNFKNIKDRL